MKTNRLSPRSLFLIAVAVLLLASRPAQAQNGSVPVVTIFASIPDAWPNAPGQFSIIRVGETNYTLQVFYRIGGTASNGLDYAQIPSAVAIPAGSRHAEISIYPNPTSAVRPDKTVELQLIPSPLDCPTPPCGYDIGSPSNATVLVHFSTSNTNVPPTVHIVTPTNGATFFGRVVCPPCVTSTPPCAMPCYFEGPNITICADARDADGYINTVQFFAGTNSLGIKTNCLPCANIQNPFCILWSNVPPGQHVLTAKATDNAGASTTSAPVSIKVSAQTNNSATVVTVTATDSYASRPCSNATPVVDTGTFTVTRHGATNQSLTVYYSLGGTASNGVDYARLGGSVTISTGAFTADILVVPLANSATAAGGNKTVVLKLQEQACVGIYPPPPDCYQVGSPGEAVVYIQGCPPSNYPPVVRIISPANRSVFYGPLNLPIYAYSQDPDDAVASVEFFANNLSLGLGHQLALSSNAASINPSNLWTLTWSNATPGDYALTAVATDTRGASRVSDPVKISILPSLPPLTNRPPLVSIAAIDPIAIKGTNCWPWCGVTNTQPTWSNWSGGTTVCRYYTNCGPKNATFAVRRQGATNDPLTVNYAVGGSASNGVDYVALPGNAIIPAGERIALITIVPIDSASATAPDCVRTVVLKLAPDPSYAIGTPAHAAAIIVDSRCPCPASGLLPDKCFHVNAAGPDGTWFRIESSPNLRDWMPLCTNQVFNGSIDFVDPDSAGEQTRFYRVVPETNAPSW